MFIILIIILLTEEDEEDPSCPLSPAANKGILHKVTITTGVFQMVITYCCAKQIIKWKRCIPEVGILHIRDPYILFAIIIKSAQSF